LIPLGIAPLTLRRWPYCLSGGIDESIAVALKNNNYREGYRRVCTDFPSALTALEMRLMKMRSVVMAAILMIDSISMHVA
jgi:hypothetical protein